MARIIKSICLGLLAVCLFVSCFQKKVDRPLSRWMEENGKLKILSTISQVGDLAAFLGGDRVDGWVLISADLDPHSYELVKGDAEKLARADIIFYNGLGLEHGAALASSLHTNKKAVGVADAIRTQAPQKILTKDGVVDPHVWMDISLWKEAIGPMADRLCEMDPEGKSYYREREKILALEMDRVHAYVTYRLHAVPTEKRFLATSHDAFRYFSRAYLSDPEDGHTVCRFMAPEGLAPDGQLNPVDLLRTIEFLKAHHIGIVFPESNVSRDAIAKVAAASRELGLSVALCPKALYGDSASGLSYFAMMQSNADVLALYLKGEESDACH